MMEVKHQSSSLEYNNDLMTSGSNNIDTDNLDADELVSNLKSAHLNEEPIQTKESLANGLLVPSVNGSKIEDAVVDLDEDDLDLGVTAAITPEMEDKLLADDDELNEVSEVPTIVDSTVEAVDVEKATVEKSSTSSNEMLRDAGDDLDTLLSKINELEECTETTATKSPASVQNANSDVVAEATTVVANDSIIVLDDSFPEEQNTVAEEKVCTAVNVAAVDSETVKTDMNEVESMDTNETEQVVAEEAPTINVVDEPDNFNITPSDQEILDVDLDTLTKSATTDRAANIDSAVAAQNKTDITDKAVLTTAEKSPIENDTTDKAVAEQNVEEEHKNEVLETIDEAVPSTVVEESNAVIIDETLKDTEISAAIESSSQEEEANKNTDETAVKIVDTDEQASSHSAINLDEDDSDDDVVFFCENSKSSLESKDTKQADNEKPAEHAANETEKEVTDKNAAQEQVHTVDDDDDVVILDDDDEAVKTTEEPTTTDVLTTAEDTTTKKTVAETTNNADEVKSAEVKEQEKQELEQPALEKPALVEVDDTRTQKEELLCDDNSDNACDKFETEKTEKKPEESAVEETAPQKPASPTDVDEMHSNCSSSSNLLQESKANINDEEADEEESPEQVEDESGEAATEVEIVETEIGEDESKESGEEKEAPPAKRMRLTVSDEEENSGSKIEDFFEEEKKQEMEVFEYAKEGEDEEKSGKLELKEDVKQEVDMKVETDKTAAKRTHESLEKELKEESASDIKKLKTEEFVAADALTSTKKSGVTASGTSTDDIEIEDMLTKEIDSKIVADATTATGTTTTDDAAIDTTVKAVPSHIPVPLYPPPEFTDAAPAVNLDFLKRFKKSFDTMTKCDLEELVLQKIVEAIIHKSEFGEMRELIEKQEKIIATHRTKITELSKQFRDLEMVHNRVLKDIEMKNSQFLMPVKITRAVGLQVFIPHKKNTEPLTNAAANSTPSPVQSPAPSPSPSSQTHKYRSAAANLLSSSSRALTEMIGTSGSGSGAGTGSVAMPPLSTRISSNTMLASAAAAAAANTRRGCMQKITPQRPMDSSLNTAPPATYARSPTQPSAATQLNSKVLNKSAALPSQMMQRPRYTGTVSLNFQQQQQQQQQQMLARQQPSPTNQIRKQSPAAPPAMPKPPNAQYRRSADAPPSSAATAGAENYMSSIHQMPSGSPTVSITPAKPKDKSVIDLTDEDDALPTTASAPNAAPAAVRQRLPNAPSASAGPASNYILNKLSNTPARATPTTGTTVSKNLAAARQQLSALTGGSKSNGNSPIPTNISTPPGTSITRIQVPSRIGANKYSHPAPLPPTPTQNLNPAWKLPPPRPTIRISNLDNGIVISWTVEESMERHADCVSYQIYAYQETSGPPLIDSWRHVGDVKAMLLPMAVTLTQFQEGQRYYFAVRAVDVHHRVGPFSLPKTWS